jgi:hypothetical protein
LERTLWGVLGANAATNIGNAYSNAGNARASGILAGGRARADLYYQADQSFSDFALPPWGSKLLFGYGRG